MKPKKLSKKLNLLGDVMNLNDAFKSLKNTTHDSSFEQLDDWLQNTKPKSNTMKPIYKIAASIIITAMVLIACSIPVEQNEEIGFMIKGKSSFNIQEMKSKNAFKESFDNAKGKFGDQIVFGISVEQKNDLPPITTSEVVLLLPDANMGEADKKLNELNAIFNFDEIDILPIQQEREVPLYEAALSKFNIKMGNGISDEELVKKMNNVLHENSNISGKAEISTDENGNKIVEIVIEEVGASNTKNMLNTIDPNTIKSITIKKNENDDNKTIDIEIDEIIEKN